MNDSASIFRKNKDTLKGPTAKKEGIAAPGNVKEARCHAAQTVPTITVEVTTLPRCSNFGNRKPRHPNSSPNGPNGSARRNAVGTAAIPAPTSARRLVRATTAMMYAAIGTQSANIYQPQCTRHRVSARSATETPARPSVSSSTITAAMDGPNDPI